MLASSRPPGQLAHRNPLGLIQVGGAASYVALMRREVVERLTKAGFIALVDTRWEDRRPELEPSPGQSVDL